MIKLNQHLKRIIKSSLEINEFLSLNQCVDKINAETSLIFECSYSNLYIVDEINREFLTKNKKNNETLRINFKNGNDDETVLDHVYKLGKAIKIDELKKSRFSENETNAAKNMICSPITDKKGKIIGIHFNLLHF